MGKSSGNIELEQITLEQVKGFYRWLQGKSCPTGNEFTHLLKLSPVEAFCVMMYVVPMIAIKTKLKGSIPSDLPDLVDYLSNSAD